MEGAPSRLTPLQNKPAANRRTRSTSAISISSQSMASTIRSRRSYASGPPREPLSPLARADAFVVTRAENDLRFDFIRKRLRDFNPVAPAFRTRLISRAWGAYCVGESVPSLAGRRVGAFCGLGNPDNFWSALQPLGPYGVFRWSFDDLNSRTEPHFPNSWNAGYPHADFRNSPTKQRRPRVAQMRAGLAADSQPARNQALSQNGRRMWGCDLLGTVQCLAAPGKLPFT